MKLYLIGSLRNPKVPALATTIRDKTGWDVFDDWYAAGPEADDYWKKYEQEKGSSYEEALLGHAATHVFEYDKSHIDSSDAVLLYLPAGRSGHLEFGYSIGKGKPGYILLDDAECRWDVMYRFATGVLNNESQLYEVLDSLRRAKHAAGPVRSRAPTLPLWEIV